MSKSIIIQVDGTAQTLQDVEKLRTKRPGRDTEDWLPEDETQTAAITIIANGTYSAGESGLYGYSMATVNVQELHGTIDGVPYIITVDENGDLVETPAGVDA